MLDRLRALNPHSVQSLIKRLLEAHTRGYWNPDEEILEKLREMIRDLDDRRQGVISA
jgi:magnesium chelatase subunit H